MFAQGMFNIDPNATPEQIQRNREALQRLMPNFGQARYTGQGLAHLAAGIVGGLGNRQFNRAESAGNERAASLFERLIGGASGTAEGSPFSGSTVTPSSRSFAPGSGASNTSGVAAAVSGNTSAPTAGLRHMLPDSDPDQMDPRRGSFATAAPRVDDPNIFTTRVSGATAGVNPDLLRSVGNSVEQAYGPGAAVGVTSGRRHGHAGGSDHNSGEAVDFNVTDRAGVQSTSGDPRIFDTARVAAGDNVRAVGIGPDYMGGNHFHFGTGDGQGIPNARAWSDWNTGAELARFGRNSAGPTGAGDPNFRFASEMQGIMDGRAVPTGTTGTRGAATAVAGGSPASAPQAGGLTTTASAQNVPQAAPQGAQGGGASLNELYAALGNPWLSTGQRQAIAGMIQQREQAADPMRRLQMERLQLQNEQLRNPQADPMAELQMERLRLQIEQMQNPQADWRFDNSTGQFYDANNPTAGAMPIPNFVVPEDGPETVINMPGQSEFDDVFAREDAQIMASASEAGLAAQRNIGRIDELGTLLDGSPTGFGAALRIRAGEFGINTEDLNDLQAAQALINSLVPEQRQPGSGPMSDADLALFQQSLPRLINTPEGNRQIISTMRAIAEYDAEGARIVQQLRSGDLTRAEAFEALQSRENPLARQAQPQADAPGPAGGSQVAPTSPEARATNTAPAVPAPQGFPAAAWAQISPENQAAAADLWMQMTDEERREFTQ